MKKLLLTLAAVLIAAPAFAQYPAPGYPPIITGGALVPALDAGVTVSGTAETILFKLDGDSAATQTFLSFTNVATPTKVLVFQSNSSSSTPFWTLTATNATSGMSVQLTPVSFGTIPAVASDNTKSTLSLQDVVTNTFLSFTNVATPANVITMAQDSSALSLTTTVTDGTASVTTTVQSSDWLTTVTDGAGNTASAQVGPGNISLGASDGVNASSMSLSSQAFGVSATSGTNSVVNTADATVPSLTTTVTDGTNSTSVTHSAGTIEIVSNEGIAQGILGVEGTTFTLSTADGSGNQVTMTGEADTASMTMTMTDGVDTGEFRVVPKGVKASALAVSPSQEWASLIQGGFTLDGTATSSPASTVTVTVVDTTPTIVDGDVQVCGYTDTTNQTNLLKTCETIDFSGGAAALATTATFIEVTNIKASSFSVLGGGGDETIAADFTTGPVPILAAVNLTNSTKSVFTASLSGDSWNYQAVTCLDLQGCDLTLGEDVPPVEGHELLLALQTATTAIVFVDVDAQMEMAGDANDTLNALDVIKFLYSGGAWLQVSLSEN